MKDFLLDENHDIVLENFDLALTDQKTITTQKIKQTLLLFQGEWFLNEEAGMPYFDEILGKQNSISRIKTLYTRAIEEIEEVEKILSLNIELASKERGLKIDVEVLDIYNNLISINL